MCVTFPYLADFHTALVALGDHLRQRFDISDGCTRENVTIPPGVVECCVDVLKVPEADYLHGVGDLILRVTGVMSTERLPDGEWLKLRGMQRAWNGQEQVMRHVLVRLATVASSRVVS